MGYLIPVSCRLCEVQPWHSDTPRPKLTTAAHSLLLCFVGVHVLAEELLQVIQRLALMAAVDIHSWIIRHSCIVLSRDGTGRDSVKGDNMVPEQPWGHWFN
jgi:hypothetical protein